MKKYIIGLLFFAVTFIQAHEYEENDENDENNENYENNENTENLQVIKINCPVCPTCPTPPSTPELFQIVNCIQNCTINVNGIGNVNTLTCTVPQTSGANVGLNSGNICSNIVPNALNALNIGIPT